MQEYSRSLADAVKRARGELGLTQNQVANIAEIDERTVLNMLLPNTFFMQLKKTSSPGIILSPLVSSAISQIIS